MRPALLPRRILAWSPGKSLEFVLRVHWDGDFSVTSWGRSRWPGNGTAVAIDPASCMRRRLRMMPGSRAELEAVATDLFPFDLSSWHLVLHQGRDSLEVCAVEDSLYQKAVDGSTTAVIAAPDADAIRQALRHRLRHGRLFDLCQQETLLIGPAPLFATGNAALLVASVFLLVSTFLIGQSSQTRILRAEILALQDKAAPINQRRQAAGMMVRSVEELGRFARRPGASFATTLGNILSAVPPGSMIDKITLKGQKIVISGLGNGAKDWLRNAGVPEEAIEISDLAKTDRFTVTIQTTSE